MDRVGFGRALGYGAREAAKALTRAAEAAAAPNPRATPPAARAETGQARVQPEQVVRNVVQAGAQARGQAKTLRTSVMTPVKRFSSVLWLEVTGTFFAIIAMMMGEGIWQRRMAYRGSVTMPETQKLCVFAVGFAVFAYFAISSFVRARRAGRR